MNRKTYLMVGLLLLGVALAFAPQNPLRQGYYFSAVGGNDADIGIERTEVSGAAVLDFDFTTSDTNEYRMTATELWLSSNSLQFEGSTADAYETILSSADVGQDTTWTFPDVTSGAVTVGDFAITHCTGPLATHSIDTIIFLADRAYTITDIDAVWQTAESAGTLGIMPEKLNATDAVASGDDLIQTAFDGTATANTVVNGTLTATTAYLDLAAGDRIGLDFTDDVAGELLNVCVTIGLVPN